MARSPNGALPSSVCSSLIAGPSSSRIALALGPSYQPLRNSRMQKTPRSSKKRSKCCARRVVSGPPVGRQLRRRNLRGVVEARGREVGHLMLCSSRQCCSHGLEHRGVHAACSRLAPVSRTDRMSRGPACSFPHPLTGKWVGQTHVSAICMPPAVADPRSLLQPASPVLPHPVEHALCCKPASDSQLHRGVGGQATPCQCSKRRQPAKHSCIRHP